MALSVRNALQCIGPLPGASVGTWEKRASVVQDLFGYYEAPKRLSLRRQLELLEGDQFDINVILVGADEFADDDLRATTYAIQFAREIFEKVDLGIARVGWYYILKAQAGSKVVIDSDSEAEELTEDWVVPNGAIDIYAVPKITNASGWGPVGGPCADHKTLDSNSLYSIWIEAVFAMMGIVVSIDSGELQDFDFVGNSFAHELGHYLGLEHAKDAENFLLCASNSWTGITASQGKKMKQHCMVRAGCHE